MSKKVKGSLLIVFGVLVLGAAGWYFFGRSQATTEAATLKNCNVQRQITVTVKDNKGNLVSNAVVHPTTNECSGITSVPTCKTGTNGKCSLNIYVPKSGHAVWGFRADVTVGGKVVFKAPFPSALNFWRGIDYYDIWDGQGAGFSLTITGKSM